LRGTRQPVASRDGNSSILAEDPLSRASVTFRRDVSTVTPWTADGSNWAFCGDQRDNPLMLVVSQDGFTALTETVKVRSGGTTTADVALQPAGC
jgi:hypothetical protein